MTRGTSFEPEVSFPSDPYDAASVFFGVMAYPESGAGQEGGVGHKFATSLHDFMRWSARKHKGLASIRETEANRKYVAPKWRDFEGPLNRGLKRIDRRMAAYDLYGYQILRGFFAVAELGAKALQEGRAEEAFHMSPTGGASPARSALWKEGTPSARRMLSRATDYWSKRFGLNATNRAADSEQKAKDLQRRALYPSIPVLHMAHAVAEAARSVGPRIQRWNERDPFLALAMNAELWIWDAIATAERWRVVPHLAAGLALKPEQMVALVVPEPTPDRVEPPANLS